MDAYLIPIKITVLVFIGLVNLISIPYLFWEYHKKGALTFFKGLIIYSFVFYFMGAFFMTLLPLPSKEFVSSLTGPTTQLIPFRFVADIVWDSGLIISNPKTYFNALTTPVVLQVIFNIVLTLPFGIYLRYYFKKDLKQVLILTFFLSLFYELTQITGVYGMYARPYRLFDVDDLLLNTLGGAVGYFLTPALVFMFPSREEIDRKVRLEAQRVPFLRRVFAYLIDYNLVYFMIKLITGIFYVNPYLVQFIVAITLGILYKVSDGKTIGYRLLRLRLVSLEKDSLTLSQTLVRSLSFAFVYNMVFIVSMDFFNYLNDRTFEYPYVFAFYIILMFVAQFILVFHVIYTGIIKRRLLFYERLSNTQIKSNLREN